VTARIIRRLADLPGQAAKERVGARPPRQLLTRLEAARQINVSLSTWKRLARAGAVAEIRVSERLIRVDPGSVASFISSRKTAAVPSHEEAAA
jgi:hypothetical protein